MSNEQIHDEAEMTFGEHLDEVRKILVRASMIFALLFIVLFIMKGIVLDVVFAPIRETFPTNRLFIWLSELMGAEALRIHPENVDLFNNKMAGQFLLHIKSSLVGAFVIAFPYLIYELWLFVKPALPPHQRKQSIRYVIETPIWFITGLMFGYFIISPLAINFLGNYQVSEQISNIIDVSSFMSTVISVSFAAAIAFQLPLLIRLLATMGIVTSSGMRQYRRVAAALLVFAAVITPPDVVSQVLIFVPCYTLYEYGIGIAERIEKRRAQEEAAYQAQLAAEKAEAEAKAKAEREAAEKEAAEKAEKEQNNESNNDETPAEQHEKATESDSATESTPEVAEATEPEQPAEENAEVAEQTEESEAPAEQTTRKSGEQTDEAPDNPNPGDYSVMDEHEVTFGVSESSEDELEIMRRFMKKDE